MSLFGSREWWAARLGDCEEFDQGSLCVANIDNDPSGAVKLVTASLQGVLRVHLPRAREHRVEDCLLEARLEAGVLQIETGRFAAGGGLALAVLMPRKLAVFRFEAAGTSFLKMTRLYEHALEHTAANMAVGTFGGGLPGRDAICVQSYDGQLSFFEREVAALSRFLPNFLVPGPLCFCPSTGSLVTCSAALELESYRYGALASAGAAAGAGARGTGVTAVTAASPAPASAARVQPDWKLVLGEAAVDIRPIRVSPSSYAGAVNPGSSSAPTPSGSRRDLLGGGSGSGATAPREELLVVGEHTLFVVSAASGQPLLQRRLDYHPACCWPYPLPPQLPGGGSFQAAGGGGGGDGLLVATHSRALLVYQGPALAWAARLDVQPVALRVAELGGVRGMIAAIDDAGRLSAFYLGTDPPSHAVAPSCDARPLDYAAMDREHRELLGRIQAAGGNDVQMAATAAAAAEAAAAASRLVIKASVPRRLDSLFGGASESSGPTIGSPAGGSSGGGERQVTVQMLLNHHGQGVLKDVRLSVWAPPPVHVSDPSLELPEVPSAGAQGGAEPARVRVAFSTAVAGGAAAVPASNAARVVASWRHPSTGEPCCSTLEVELPLALFCTAVPPEKTAECKLTVDTNREPPHMQLLFHDLVSQVSPPQAEALARTQSANALGFQFGGAGGPIVSVLVSKAGGRYRVQSDCFHPMWLVTQELLQRLPAHYKAADAKPGAPPIPPEGQFVASLQEMLPVQDVFDLIEAHFVARRQARTLATRLEERAAQFRAVQKRLLIRFKDKAPSPLGELDTLMAETYDQIITLADDAEAAQGATRMAARALGGGLQLLLCLARLKLGLGEEDAAALRQALPPVVEETEGEGPEIGWEEEAEAALTQLLRSALARNAKEAAVAVAPLAPAPDTQRLRKHLGLVLERLGKGMRLGGSGGSGKGGSGGDGGGGGG